MSSVRVPRLCGRNVVTGEGVLKIPEPRIFGGDT